MDFVVEAVLEVAGELISEGIDAAVTARKEKKRETQNKKGEETDVSEELNH